MHTLKTFDRILGRALRVFCVLLLVVLTILMSGVVFIRFVDIQVFTSNQAVINWFKLSWSDEVTEWLMTALIFLGSAELWRTRDHFTVDILTAAVTGTAAGRVLMFIIEILAAAFILAFTVYSFDLATTAGRSSPILGWPMKMWYAPMPVAGAIMFAYSIRNLVVRIDDLFDCGWFATKAARQ
jgi:TRAP-type C4-dicarboxylate transport system permease small subunit